MVISFDIQKNANKNFILQVSKSTHSELIFLNLKIL